MTAFTVRRNPNKHAAPDLRDAVDSMIVRGLHWPSVGGPIQTTRIYARSAS